MDLEKKPTGCTSQMFWYSLRFVVVVWLILSLLVAWLQSMGILVFNITGTGGQTTGLFQVPFLLGLLNSMWFFGIVCIVPFCVISLFTYLLLGRKKDKSE
ncbi:hypothetical protein KBD68_01615 [Candidatus Woesebacteria bacterium]|nr:hypothetical protein [Candidatus Woesebacteria bacterium]